MKFNLDSITLVGFHIFYHFCDSHDCMRLNPALRKVMHTIYTRRYFKIRNPLLSYFLAIKNCQNRQKYIYLVKRIWFRFIHSLLIKKFFKKNPYFLLLRSGTSMQCSWDFDWVLNWVALNFHYKVIKIISVYWDSEKLVIKHCIKIIWK